MSEEQGNVTPQRAHPKRRQSGDGWRRLMNALGEREETLGAGLPPGSRAALDFGPINDDGLPLFVARAGNDGYDAMVGYRDRWLWMAEMSHARRFAWWLLWDVWASGTWFGLKRRLYYSALSRFVAQMPPWQVAPTKEPLEGARRQTNETDHPSRTRPPQSPPSDNGRDGEGPAA